VSRCKTSRRVLSRVFQTPAVNCYRLVPRLAWKGSSDHLGGEGCRASKTTTTVLGTTMRVWPAVGRLRVHVPAQLLPLSPDWVCQETGGQRVVQRHARDNTSRHRGMTGKQRMSLSHGGRTWMCVVVVVSRSSCERYAEDLNVPSMGRVGSWLLSTTEGYRRGESFREVLLSFSDIL
jgi:hypothetical protein